MLYKGYLLLGYAVGISNCCDVIVNKSTDLLFLSLLLCSAMLDNPAKDYSCIVNVLPPFVTDQHSHFILPIQVENRI